MEYEIDQVVRAILIASDPAQPEVALHQQALAFLSEIQKNANSTWRLALPIFTDQTLEGSRKYPSQARFFALRVLDEFFDNKYESFDEDTFRTIQQRLVAYIQSEYVLGSAESDCSFLRNKFSHTLTLFFLCTYIEQWPTFFSDFFTLLPPADSASHTAFNRHISLLFFHIILEISGEVADQMIKSARPHNAVRQLRDGQVRDAVRQRDAAQINEAVLTLIAKGSERATAIRQSSKDIGELSAVIEIVDWGVRTFASYVGWIDINLTVTPRTVPLLFSLLADSSLPVRLATSAAFLRIIAKGLKEPGDKLSLFKVLSLGDVLETLEAKTRIQQTERGSNIDEGEESYREALGKLLNVLLLEVAKLTDDCSDGEISCEASKLMTQLLPILLRFLADPYDDTSSTVFLSLQVILSAYKRSRKISAVPLDQEKRTFLSSLLEILIIKMKWDIEADLDDVDEDDNAEFEKMRKELRVFIDSILVIDQNLVTESIRRLALKTLSTYQSGMEWNEAELGVYLVFIFGEINKSGGRGRAAFCQTPGGEKWKGKGTDTAECILTPHGEMLYALVHSGIASHGRRVVALQFFETVARYTDFFKARKECILPTLDIFIGERGLHNENSIFRRRVYYLFYRFTKETKNDIPADICTKVIDRIRNLLPISVELPHMDESSEDLLTETVKSSFFDSQLYLYEAVGVLCSGLRGSPDFQADLLLSLVKPLMQDLSASLEASTNTQDVISIARVHHIIMALGNISKGFPEYPSSPPEGYTPPPIEVLAEVTQAILVCLEAMNVFKPVRDATRFAFARIVGTTGPSVMHFITPLMKNLLVHFEPAELSDFMNFISLLIHKLQTDMFDVMDQLIGPLCSHVITLLCQPTTGTDDERSRVETKKAYLALLNNIMSAKLHAVFTSERNSESFERLLDNVRQQSEDISDPVNQKAALLFLNKAVMIWGRMVQNIPNGMEAGLPGFERFIYERLVPAVFRVPSIPGFNSKDGQMLVILHEIANLLQVICHTRGPEAYSFFLEVFLPLQKWPEKTAAQFTNNIRDLDGKSFRRYFADFVRSSVPAS